jgi:hypothetical protein
MLASSFSISSGNVSSSVAYNAGATFTERLSERPGALDFLGFDVGQRALPEEIQEEERDIIRGFGTFGIPDDELELLAESFPLTWSPVFRTIPLDFGLSVSARDKIELDERKSLGFNASALYSSGWGYEERVERSYLIGAGDVLQPFSDYISESTTRDADIGLLFDLKYEDGSDFAFESTTLFLHATDGETEVLSGEYVDDGVDLEQTQISWIEQTLLNQSFGSRRSSVRVNGAERALLYNFALAQRLEPDTRFSTYWDEVDDGDFDPTNQLLSPRSYGAGRYWTRVLDLVNDFRYQWTIPTFLFGDGADFFDLGVYAMYQ